MKTVEIYTDGACSGNPGPGGWGAVLRYNGHEKEISGGEAHTTNNRMELMAVIEALSLLKEPCEVKLYSDRKRKSPQPRIMGEAFEAVRYPRRRAHLGQGSRGSSRERAL